MNTLSQETNHEINTAKSILIRVANRAESQNIPQRKIRALESLIARLEDWQNRK